MFKKQEIEHPNLWLAGILGFETKSSRGCFSGVTGSALRKQPAVVDRSAKTVQCRRIHGDLYLVVQVTVFHLAQEPEELVIRKTPEGLEIGEAILAEVSGVECSTEFTRDANW